MTTTSALAIRPDSIVTIKGKKYLNVTNQNLVTAKVIDNIDPSKSDVFFEHIVSKHWTPAHIDVTNQKIEFINSLENMPSWLDRIHDDKLKIKGSLFAIGLKAGVYSRAVRIAQNNHTMIELYDELYKPANNTLNYESFGKSLWRKWLAFRNFSFIQFISNKWEEYKIWKARREAADRNAW